MHAVHESHDVDLQGLDLNLLVVLDALLSTRSVTEAARRLHLSQSATSHALARLREALGDALLVRGRGGLTPTVRAQQMAAPVKVALEAVREAVARPRPFDPWTARRGFTVGGADYSEFVLLPALMRRMGAVAPGIDIAIHIGGAELTDDLTDGACDLGIGVDRSTHDRPGIRTRALFAERLVCVVRKDHPALARRWTPQRFAAMDHALIAPGGRPGGAVDLALAELGLQRRVALMTPHFLAAPFVVAQTDLVLTLPERVALAFAAVVPLVVVPPPLPLPGFSIVLLWHERTHDDPAHRWLRQQIAELAAPARGARRR